MEVGTNATTDGMAHLLIFEVAQVEGPVPADVQNSRMLLGDGGLTD